MKDILPIVFLNFSWLGVHTFHMQVLPDFEPNEYLFTTHADKGKERWEIFAWAVRDIMQKQGKLGLSELPLRLKRVYFDYVGGRSDADPVLAYNELMKPKDQ